MKNNELSLQELFNKYKKNNKDDIIYFDSKILQVPSLNKKTQEIEYCYVKRLIRHKVSKERYQILSEANNKIIVTNDHSCIIYRNFNFIEVKASEIYNTDYLIELINDNDWRLSSIKNIKKLSSYNNQYVYDIEVDSDDHVFFGNNILVHNSTYFSVEGIVKHLFNDTMVNWNKSNVDKICKELDKFTDIVNENCNKITQEDFKSPLKRIEFKRETFAPEAIFLAKKRYVLHIKDDEGIFTDKFKYTGVDVKKNEIPETIKSLLSNVIEQSLVNYWDGDKYIKEINKIWETFKSLNPNEIGFIKNYKTEKEINGFMKTAKGTGIHAKSAIFYNQIINKLQLTHKYDKINVGDRIRYIYLKPNQYGITAIGWVNNYPNEFYKEFDIDYKTMFEKIVMSPLKRFIEIYCWPNVHPANQIQKSILDL